MEGGLFVAVVSAVLTVSVFLGAKYRKWLSTTISKSGLLSTLWTRMHGLVKHPNYFF
jgi:hypothetical protein